MAATVADVRDEVYTRILLKKNLSGYSENSFDLSKTWRPYELLEDLVQNFPNGKVYIVACGPGDIVLQDRKAIIGTREYCVFVGFQIAITDVDSMSECDGYALLVEELETTCRKEFNLDGFQFSRLEYMKDEKGLPLQFIMQRAALTFESYFQVYYKTVHS